MAEVKDLENVEQEATAPAMEETAADSAAPAETRVNLKARWQAIPRKKRRRIIRLCILALLLVIAAVVLLKVLGGKSSDEGEVVTDIVQYGSITSTVQGSGLTKAKSSETITITTVGTVVDVLVAEGETVTAGTPLFTIDSPAAETAVQKARSNVEGYEKQLSQAQKDIAGLNLSAGYAGKLMETVTLNPGDSITKGQKVAVLSDDTRLRLEQYYSYAYAGDLQVGQTVNVSIPALMTSVPGTVEAVHMVSRITPEGSKLFSADIIVENEGALTADMVASATATVNGETVYPYEAGKLAYYRTGDLVSTVDGTVISSNLVGFMPAASYLSRQIAGLSFNWILIPIGMLMGWFIVQAEPAVHVLNKQVEEITSGAIPGKAMSTSLSIGVAVSIGLAMMRVMTGISIFWLVVPGYLAAIVMSFFVPKIFTAIAFDSGGVASGPMTATFLLPFAQGACEALGGNVVTDAFGVVAMVAMTPLLTIQMLGLLYQLKMKKAAQETPPAPVDEEIIEL